MTLRKGGEKGDYAVVYVLLVGLLILIILIILFVKAENIEIQHERHENDSSTQKDEASKSKQANSTIKSTSKKNATKSSINSESASKSQKKNTATATNASPPPQVFAPEAINLWKWAVRCVRKQIKYKDKSIFQKPGTKGATVVKTSKAHLVSGFFLAPDEKGVMKKSFFKCIVGKNDRGNRISYVVSISSSP
jgi:hypothetical protein